MRPASSAPLDEALACRWSPARELSPLGLIPAAERQRIGAAQVGGLLPVALAALAARYARREARRRRLGGLSVMRTLPPLLLIFALVCGWMEVHIAPEIGWAGHVVNQGFGPRWDRTRIDPEAIYRGLRPPYALAGALSLLILLGPVAAELPGYPAANLLLARSLELSDQLPNAYDTYLRLSGLRPADERLAELEAEAAS